MKKTAGGCPCPDIMLNSKKCQGTKLQDCETAYFDVTDRMLHENETKENIYDEIDTKKTDI